MEYILVALGGILGSISRYLIGNFVAKRNKSNFPIGTFIINISGAIALGVVIGLNVKGSALVLAADGFLGAFTTFSTFMFEGFNLLRLKDSMNATVYIISSIVLGIFGYATGVYLAKML